MGNTIRRPRRRPRVRSLCWRALWWCIQREAVWLILNGAWEPGRASFSRSMVARWRPDTAQRRARFALRFIPQRRYFP